MKRPLARLIVRFLRWFDPSSVPIEGKCLAITDGHEACPLWQLAQEKKAAQRGSL